MTKDPVCGMRIDPGAAAGRSLHVGNLYHFCAPICKKMFDVSPNKYVRGDIGKDRSNVVDPECGVGIDNVEAAPPRQPGL